MSSAASNDHRVRSVLALVAMMASPLVGRVGLEPTTSSQFISWSGERELNPTSARLLQSSMLLLGHYRKISTPVVPALPVLMVDDLIRLKPSSDNLLGDHSMLVYVSPSIRLGVHRHVHSNVAKYLVQLPVCARHAVRNVQILLPRLGRTFMRAELLLVPSNEALGTLRARSTVPANMSVTSIVAPLLFPSLAHATAILLTISVWLKLLVTRRAPDTRCSLNDGGAPGS